MKAPTPQGAYTRTLAVTDDETEAVERKMDVITAQLKAAQ